MTLEQINDATTYLKNNGVDQPDVSVILGTGLGNVFIKAMANPLVFEYKNIPHFPVSTVEFHTGKLIYGKIHSKNILAMQGRFHYYEGYSMHQVTFPVRVMKKLGAKYLLISNASGNLNRNWKKGELMLIDDHINLQPDNPLRGKNIDEMGSRFPDMSVPYSKRLNEELISIAKQKGITLNVGVYAAVVGPNLETRAEYRYLQRIGADVVGMSTVPEVIVANHMGLPCCAISVLTDDCDPDNLSPVDIADIINTAGEAEPKLAELYIELVKSL